MDFGYSFAGFAVGAVVGVTGVGGGSLMTPLLVLLFGIHPAVAVGTDLLYAAITKSGGTLVHAFKGNVDWRVTGWLAAGSIPAAALTLALVAPQLAASAAGSHLISIALGGGLLLTAASLIFRRHLPVLHERGLAATPGSPATTWLTVAFGAALGVLVSLSSVGAGALGITVLLLLYPGLKTARIVGSDLAHAVPLTLVAGLGHWWLGNVDWGLLGALLLGSLPGIFIGSHLSGRLPERILRPALAAMLALIAGRLITQ